MARILIVEDDPNHGAFVAAALERIGHSCSLATNGLEALRTVDACHDLVICDIFMPDLDGIELIQAIRRRGSRVPVIAMTGGLRDHLGIFLSTMYAFGAKACLAKPFGHEELADAVAHALARYGKRDGLGDPSKAA